MFSSLAPCLFALYYNLTWSFGIYIETKGIDTCFTMEDNWEESYWHEDLEKKIHEAIKRRFNFKIQLNYLYVDIDSFG